MKVTFEPIEQPDLLSDYIEAVHRYVGIQPPRAYFEANRVVGCFDEDHRLIGGYTIVTRTKLRGLAVMPEEAWKQSRFLQETPEDEMMEVNGFWLHPSVQSMAFRRSVWTQMLSDIRKTGRAFMILAYNLENVYLERLYAAFRPVPVYEGPANQPPGSRSHKNISVRYVPVNALLRQYRRLGRGQDSLSVS